MTGTWRYLQLQKPHRLTELEVSAFLLAPVENQEPYVSHIKQVTIISNTERMSHNIKPLEVHLLKGLH